MFADLFCVFLSFWALILVGFFVLHLEVVLTSARIFLTANVSHGTLGLTFCLVGIHSAAASKWALTKFSYSSFGVCVSVFCCSASNLFLSDNAYSSLISLLLSWDSPSVLWLLFGPYSFVSSVVSLPWQFGDRWTHPRKRNMPRNSMHNYFITFFIKT